MSNGRQRREGSQQRWSSNFWVGPMIFQCFVHPAVPDSSATVLVLLIVGVTTFIVKRRRRRRLEASRDEQRARNVAVFGEISAPNGLNPGRSNIPPTYQEAIKSPAVPAVSVSVVSGHEQPRSASMLMDECMRAVYDAEDGVATGTSMNEATSPSMSATSHTRLVHPTSPQGVVHGDKRQSVSRWLRNQRWMSGAGFGPVASQTPALAGLPVPPSPSYTGIVTTPTASAPQTPRSATYLTPAPSPYPEPLSARSTRSWTTGEDRLSIRASIPNSVLYPSPLQPAPPPRRLTTGRRNRASVSSAQEYGSETWRTATLHEDPPEYEPRRGNPDTVSPV